MKSRVFLFVAFFVSFSASAFANTLIKGSCFDEKGKTTPCNIESKDGTIVLTPLSKTKKYLARTIPASSVQRLTEGEFSKQRTAEAILLSPLFLLSKRKFSSYSIEYNTSGQNEYATVAVKQKQSHMLRTMLEVACSKQVAQVSTDGGGVAK